LDEGLYVLQTAAAPSGVNVNFDACDVTLSDGKSACVEIKDGACQLSDVCQDIDNPDFDDDAAAAASSKWSLLASILVLLSAVFLAN
jgi:hypothetical protein